MKRHALSTRLLAATGLFAALAVAVSACGGGDEAGATAAAGGSGSQVVSVKSVEGMNVLVDSQGQTLYSPEQERGGKILCTGGCTSIWAPVEASGGLSSASEIGGDLGRVKRPDGTEQVTFDGSPLYSFTEEGPGEVTGDGFRDAFNGTKFTWRVVTASGAPPSSSTTTPSDGGGAGGYSY